MYFVITIDTEGDNQWDEKCRRNITTENARYVPRFQNSCEKYSFKPTYLTSYEIAQDNFFVKFAKSCLKNGTCEIGAHPHGWSTPPEYDLTGDDRKYGTYLTEYPEDIIFEKIKYLKEFLENTFEIPIVSHRSGRWALSETYARVLHSLRFKVDCSVTPLLSWKNQRGSPKGNGGTDYTNFPSEPYFINLDDISRPGNSQLLELPMTVKNNYSPSLRSIYNSFGRGPFGKVRRLLCCQPLVWFRPNLKNTAAILHLIEKSFDENTGFLMFMLHSSEFMPGCNEVFKTPGDTEQLFADLDKIFTVLKRKKVKPVTCNEYYKIFTNSLVLQRHFSSRFLGD